MQAITFDRYGPPDVLTRTDIDTPQPAEGEVLVRVHAAGLNPYDWHLYRGEPYLVRPGSGFRAPRRPQVVGADLAGEVAAVGPGVSGFAVGDRVYGEPQHGACAEQAVVPADQLAPMPPSLTFAAAAAVPMGALTAYQALRRADLSTGERVLVNGASGGVGHLAVQLAKALGAAHVTAVCSGRNADWVRELGADTVVDHTRTDVTRTGETYDVVIDTAGGHPLRAMRRVMAREGRYVPIGSTTDGKLLGPALPMLRAVVAGLLAPQSVRPVLAKAAAADLRTIATWIDEGRVRPVVERVYPWDDAVAAFHHLETGHVAGKVVISVP